MKLKKIVKVVLSCMLAGALFTGCGGSSGDDDKQAGMSIAETKVGMLTRMNATENQVGDVYNKLAEQAVLNVARYTPKFYDSLRAMQMAIESGEITEVSVYKSVAEYIVANNDKFEIISTDYDKLKDSFCFAVRKDDAQLKADLDKVIGEMKADGTLDKLVDECITKVDAGQAPPKVEIPMTDGAPTIKIGVTGDLPPLDLILPDNSPAGFNTAMLAEIAKRLGRNVQPVQIESGARAAALSSGQIDVVFWVVVPVGKEMPADIDKPEGVELSTPYFEDSVAHVKLKSSK